MPPRGKQAKISRRDGTGSSASGRQGITYNTDGSINIPSDGSRYVPQAGDVIRCDDGSNYTITDVSRYDKNMFASGLSEISRSPLVTGACWSSRNSRKRRRDIILGTKEIISESAISMKPEGCSTLCIMPLAITRSPGKMGRRS